VNTKRFGPLIFAGLLFNLPLWAKWPHRTNNAFAVPMEGETAHKMIGISCQIDGSSRWHVCVVDSGATYTVVSDRVLKAEGPLGNLTTANGVVHVHQREVSLTLANGMKLKSQALVQPGLMPEGIDILLGQDVLRQFRLVVLDYDKQQVEFHR
jgi:hypothetical protein